LATVELQAASGGACASCGTEIPPHRLSCPACHALVYAAELRRLAEQAERDSATGDRAAAVAAWRQALELLPPESTQSKRVGERIAALTRDGEPKGETSAKAPSGSGARAGAISAAIVGGLLLLSKFKFVLVFVLTKVKWLALGLGKGTTLLSMLLSLGVYWAVWGWWFALGVVVSIYIHEMGHVAALDRLGIKATAPMFIPGFGAFVRLKQYPANPSEDARVGLAGPIWGMVTALACFILWYTTGFGLWGALAEWGARINLFNLMPVASLDGDRGFRALSRPGRWLVLGVMAAAWGLTREGMLLIVLLVGVVRAFGAAPADTDRRAAISFAILVVGLSLLAVLPVQMGLRP
jgi:Zn-dependent protease